MFGLFKAAKKPYDISLEDLGIEDEDLGTTWHPKSFTEDENTPLLEDISEEMMCIHRAKEERLIQPDAVTPIESAPINGSGGVE